MGIYMRMDVYVCVHIEVENICIGINNSALLAENAGVR